MATVLKLLFKVKPGVSLFRQKQLPEAEDYRNKLGYVLRRRIAILTGADLSTTSDLAKLLDAPLDSTIEALGYSDFILKWQNYFEDLPYCVILHPFRKDLRAEEDEGGDEQRLTQLDKTLHDKVHHAKITQDGDQFVIDRTLGVAKRESGELNCSIWTTRETISPDGSYKLELLDKLFDESVADEWAALPKWFPNR